MFKKLTRKELEKFLARYVFDGKVLDIGAGGSSYHKFFPNRITLDVDETRKPDIVGDAQKLPFEDNSFEMILCTEVLEHIPDPVMAIKEMKRVLKPEGKLVLSTRFVFPIHDAPGDYWRFTKYGLLKLFADWEVLEIMAEAPSFKTLAILVQRMMFQINFKCNKLIKIILFFVTLVISRLDFLIKNEYGDIKKTKAENDILSSGYYLAAKKK